MTIQKRVQDLFNRFNVDLEVTQQGRTDMAEATLENGTVIYTDADSFVEGAEAYIINDEGEQIGLPEGDYELDNGDVLQVVEGGKIGAVKKAEGKGEGEGEAKGEGKGKGPAKGVNPKSVTKPVDDGADAGGGDAGGGDAGGGGGKGAPSDGGGKKKKKGLSADEDQLGDKKEEEFVDSYVTRQIVEDMIREAVESALAYKDKDETLEEEEVKEEMSVNPEAPKGHSEDHAPVEEPAAEIEVEIELEEEPAKEELSAVQSEIEFLKTQLAEIKKQAASKGVQRMAPTKRTEPVDLTNLTTQERVRALANQFSSNNG